jgi:hypothetical protein
MAKKTKRSSALVPFRMTAPKPIIVRQTKVVHTKSKKTSHRRHSSGGMLGGLTDAKRIGIVVGGAALGFIQKQGLQLPKLPLLGEAGTIGLIAYFVSDGGRNKLADEICTASLTVAAYELASTGTIAGPGGDVDGFVQGY